MAKVTFDAKSLERVVDHALAAPKHRGAYGAEPDGPALWLVGDRGVYMMSNGDPMDEIRGSFCVYAIYADGIHPVNNPDDWYDAKVSIFGGDDFIETLPWCKEIKAAIVAGATKITLNVTKRGISFTSNRKVKA